MFSNRKKLFKWDVALNAILYIIQRLHEVDIHKVCKILYYTDQMHLDKYGRTTTGDTYIRMPYGPVPSNVEDIFKALRRESFFSDMVGNIGEKLIFVNRYFLTSNDSPDLDYLSETDVECLNTAIMKCKDLNFEELTEASHGYAWNSAQNGQEIDFADILREVGSPEEYIDYICEKRKSQLTFLD